MKEQVLDRLVCLLKYFKGLEHENNEKEYAYILKGTINGITYSIKNLEDFFENEEYLAKNPPFNPEYNSTYWYLAPCGDYCSKCFLGDAKDLLLMEAGLCFKTKREAIDNKEKTIKIWSDIKDKYKQQLVKEHKHGRMKPCPFCGGEGRLQAVITESRINQDDYFVKCRECGASTMKYFSEQKEAIAAWNRRDGEEKNA